MLKAPTIVWLRRDLRLSDHHPLQAALRRGPVIPVYVWSPAEEARGRPGAASRWWLHHSLARLDRDLRKVGSRLVLRSGPALEALRDIVEKSGAQGLVWHRRYEPEGMATDRAVKAFFQNRMEWIESMPGDTLVEPWTVQTQSGKPFRVFSPFWRRCLQTLEPGEPLSVPEGLPSPQSWPASERLEDWNLRPTISWAEGMEAHWEPGETGAQARLGSFLEGKILRYGADRNHPDRTGTSSLSPHLHFGEITPRQVWAALNRFAERRGLEQENWRSWQFVSELGWREFAIHLLYHFPETTTRPLRNEFLKFPWAEVPSQLRAWQRGKTGYPIVDAGMRELWHHGWMHNRVRMIVASFLVKHLLVPWQKGAEWFWDTLVDADLASNTLGWQWTAGCGADAAPYFRIFNPITQGEKFDPQGVYVRRWIPELVKVPDRFLNRPWEAPAEVMAGAGVRIGADYPLPIVDHAEARQRALGAYAEMRSLAAS